MDEAFFEGLLKSGVAVRDGFLAPDECHALIDSAHLRRERGGFTPARIGNSLQRRADIRGDSICWIAEPLLEAERSLVSQFESLRQTLNRTLQLGLFDLELHYAWYPPGGGYARHVDQPAGREQRQVSLVLYLNLDWTSQSGGELRMFEGDEKFEDIAPVAGRLVTFLTAGREHAVLATQRERLSVSGWFRRRG